MKNLFFNPTTKINLESIIKNLPQSLIIYGQPGSGLTTVAEYIANQLNVKPLFFLPEKNDKIDLVEGIIGIDIIRQLYEVTATKKITKQLVILEKVETITKQAQNAFLKLLEEPNDNVFFILVTNNMGELLSTITSRTIKLEIKPLSDKQSNQLLDGIGVKDSKKRQQLLFMANGRPAELSRLANDEDYFKHQVELIATSKSLLTTDLYNKLLLIDKHREDRQETLRILQYCLLILKRTLSQNLKLNNLNNIKNILETYSQIKNNGNIRLWMTRMVLYLI